MLTLFSSTHPTHARRAAGLLLALSWTLAAFPAPGRAQSLPATAASPVFAWSALDSHNRPVSVPGMQTTLLVFLRPGQPQSAEVVKLLQPIVNQRKDLQVIGIVSGDDAAAGATQLEKAEWPYPVVTDVSYDASGTFAVRTWPTVVVVGSKGEQVAHVPGLPVTFANDVSAYLDFSAGKIDQKGLAKALANREVVAESEDQKAARHAEVALRLAQQGLPTQAAAEVARAMEFKPNTPALLASLAHTNLLLGDTKAAEALLLKVTSTDLAPSEYNCLKGWAAMQAERWTEAKSLLLEAVKLNPNPTQAFYLLGRVYEHENDTPHAVECYRKAFEHTSEGKPLIGR